MLLSFNLACRKGPSLLITLTGSAKFRVFWLFWCSPSQRLTLCHSTAFGWNSESPLYPELWLCITSPIVVPCLFPSGPKCLCPQFESSPPFWQIVTLPDADFVAEVFCWSIPFCWHVMSQTMEHCVTSDVLCPLQTCAIDTSPLVIIFVTLHFRHHALNALFVAACISAEYSSWCSPNAHLCLLLDLVLCSRSLAFRSAPALLVRPNGCYFLRSDLRSPETRPDKLLLETDIWTQALG